MADDRKAPDEPFLQRWARRKAEAATAEPAPEAPEAETTLPANEPDLPARAGDDPEATEIDLAALPDIDSLDETSDFSIFMRDGIPDALRTRALQRLWRLDPSFGHVDGLLEYGEDFTGSGLAAEAVKSLYKVGRGMRPEESETAEDAPPADAADAETAENETAADTPPAENEAAGEAQSDDSEGAPERSD